ncbi:MULTISPECIES: hypothetical protein [Bacillus]|uniref:YtxH domain-containing protein n=1 Tax=Bacillus glycinifermentans TaxID=1664069 RepID=A0AAJ4D1C1_9BACI|nr:MULTISPECIES: hypothetical protein [Bacillus]KKB73577.1 hypothetical protein TH62_11660 [Bacillus sp. TH008]MDU0072402.1 hypothetical protein [Bacillus sp. IG6]MED8020195.1 hypothetical protein [Bacillus glycinifermentans]QAT64275.1 hypothetical protein EQZ20_04615 [Bacillus glycinifermentans]WKB78179.1 hypothetical protein QYM22_04715 [Bacillus glycinifermentans]
MKGERVVLRNILLGASVGAVMSLLHKPTREACGAKLSACKSKVKLYRNNPNLLTDCIKEKIEETKKLSASVTDDLNFLNQQIRELKETTPKVIELIEETREHFSKKSDNRLE